MARRKPNAYLAKYEAKQEAKYHKMLDIHDEIDYMAMMLMLNDELHVGPGRADQMFNAFLANKMEIADMVVEDSKGDTSIIHTKSQLAKRMAGIFGREHWPKRQHWFTMLREFWVEVEKNATS